MRGPDTQQSSMFSYLSPEERVPAKHPLRPIRRMVDDALKALSPEFSHHWDIVPTPWRLSKRRDIPCGSPPRDCHHEPVIVQWNQYPEQSARQPSRSAGVGITCAATKSDGP